MVTRCKLLGPLDEVLLRLEAGRVLALYDTLDNPFVRSRHGTQLAMPPELRTNGFCELVFSHRSAF